MSTLPNGYGLTSEERRYLAPKHRDSDVTYWIVLAVVFVSVMHWALFELPWPSARAEVPQTNEEACAAWHAGDYEVASSSVAGATALCSSLGL